MIKITRRLFNDDDDDVAAFFLWNGWALTEFVRTPGTLRVLMAPDYKLFSPVLEPFFGRLYSRLVQTAADHVRLPNRPICVFSPAYFVGLLRLPCW